MPPESLRSKPADGHVAALSGLSGKFFIGADRPLTAPTLATFPSVPNKELTLSAPCAFAAMKKSSADVFVDSARRPPSRALFCGKRGRGRFPCTGVISPATWRPLTAATADVFVSETKSQKTSAARSAVDVFSMSRRGLSVHAVPFQPRSANTAAPLNLPEFGAAPHRSQPEFPRTPVTPLTAATPINAVTPLTTLSASRENRENRKESAERPSVTPPSNAHSAHTVYAPVLQPRQLSSMALTSGSYGSSQRCSNELIMDGSNSVRHRRVPFTDAQAMDEAAMIDMLRGSDSDGGDDDDEEQNNMHHHLLYNEEDKADADLHPHCLRHDDEDEDDEGATFLVHPPQQQQPHMAECTANENVYNCAGGYWDLEGPRAATRRYMRRGASFIMNSQNSEGEMLGSLAASNLSGADIAAIHDAERNEIIDEEDMWEMNSSAYAESLDEAQVEWIEEQLRAKENPEGFFL